MISNSNQRAKIMLFGTFDILHKGHFNLFKQARKLSRHPFLIISLARDINVKKIKGRLPVNSEKKRLSAIIRSKMADRAVLGSSKNYIAHIIKEKPDIIALGYDQKAYTQNLKKLLKNHGLTVKVVRLKAFRPSVFKSSLMKKL